MKIGDLINFSFNPKQTKRFGSGWITAFMGGMVVVQLNKNYSRLWEGEEVRIFPHEIIDPSFGEKNK